MIEKESKEIEELLSDIPKCQVNEFKGELEHSETTPALTEPNDSPFRVRRLSRSFSIPTRLGLGEEEEGGEIALKPDENEKEEILLADENRDSSVKSKFIILKRSRSLGNIFLPESNKDQQQVVEDQMSTRQAEGKDDDDTLKLTEKLEALEIEVLPDDNEIQKAKSEEASAAEIVIKTVDPLKISMIDRPQTSPPILYPNKNINNNSSSSSNNEKMSILDRMQKSLGFIFKCARKDENSNGSSEEEDDKNAAKKLLKYPIRSRTPDVTRSKKGMIPSGDVPMQAMNFVTKVDESSTATKINAENVKKIPHFIDVSGPKGPLLAPQHSLNEGKKCLVLDLDETLVHSSFHVPLAHDLVVSLGLPDGTFQNIYVAKRPGVDEFLARVSEVFEVVIFTASLAHYADPVIDFLTVGMNRYLREPREISLRLYRESCLFLRGLYVKDLSRLGRNLEHTVIVDNSPASFLLQPEHGIPIKSWFNDTNDRELALLQESLEHLIGAESVSEWRSIIRGDIK